MIDKSYDVIIVGAGPAGLSSAKSCAEHNLKTLLVEEHPAIGAPVQCGEALARFVFVIMFTPRFAVFTASCFSNFFLSIPRNMLGSGQVISAFFLFW